MLSSKKKKTQTFALKTFSSKITLVNKSLNLHSLMSVAVAKGSSYKKSWLLKNYMWSVTLEFGLF